MSAIFLVSCSLQHPATPPTSPTSPSFAFQRDGGTQSTSGPRPPWHRLGYTMWDDLLKLTRLTNFGIFSKSTDQLWDFLHNFGIQMESTHFLLCDSVNAQHLAGLKNQFRRKQKAENLMPTDALQCRSNSPTVPSTTRATPKSNCLKVSFSHCVIHGYPYRLKAVFPNI